MKFTIERASDYEDGLKAPCEGCKQDILLKNKTEVSKCWTKEINSLEELLALEKEVKTDLIVFTDNTRSIPLGIIIHDDYIE